MKKKYHLYLTADERRIILDSFIDKKNELIRTGHFTDAIDEIIIKVRRREWFTGKAHEIHSIAAALF